MKHAHLIEKLDEPRILAAITAAEEKTSGMIRVMVSKRSHPDALAAAKKHFEALKMNRTPDRNAVLIFVAPKSQTFAVYGDAATHARVGAAFWNVLRDDIAAQLKEARFTDALVHGINKAGELLAEHFPRVGKDSK
ncbi:MAG TPA: TPM domain-containing protein [Tepidisphaeraceae bacterium]|jgi:uncharacterized membrane protein